MSQSFYSQSWHRVANIKPCLTGHIEIHRHHYRGELWYVLQDHASGKSQRLTPSAYLLISLMDGQRTAQEILDVGRLRLGEDAPTEDDFVRLLSQLHAVDALKSDVLPDIGEMLKRFNKTRHQTLKQNLRSPMFVRFPLLDPERFLVRLMPLVRPAFSTFGLVVWLAVVGYGVYLAGLHWTPLTENLADRVLAPRNLFLIWLIYPFIKALHEFGHAFAVTASGGEVHEMGIMLLVFMPIPYVDASSASAFQSKKAQVLVGAAGILIELFVAALALVVWASIEPGPARAVAYYVILVAGISTLLFNGNPLLRYDAYYILADLLEIPNFASRGIKYVGYLLQRYLLGMKDLEPPHTAPGERFWFVVYTIAAFCYRLLIYVGIILFVASKFFFIGIMIACWAVITMLVLPLGKIVHFLATSPRLRRNRAWAISVVAITIAGVGLCITLVPVPLGTRADGVVWIPDHGFVRAATDGFIERVLVTDGAWVDVDEPVFQCSDPLLPAEIRLMEARVTELQAIYNVDRMQDRARAEISKREIARANSELADARRRAADLIVRAATSGYFVAPVSQDLPGRYVRRGQLLGYVLNRSAMTARVAVGQVDADMVRGHTRGVQVRFPESVARKLPSGLVREVPAATNQLPSLTLSRAGGGDIAVDPRENMRLRSFEKLFLFDIDLPQIERFYRVGERVYVRFDHGREPLIYRWSRSFRQLFLKHFNV